MFVGGSRNLESPKKLFREVAKPQKTQPFVSTSLSLRKTAKLFLSIIHENHAFRIMDALDNDIHFFQRKWLV